MLSMQQMKLLSYDVETPEDIIKSESVIDTFSFTVLQFYSFTALRYFSY